MSFMEDTFADLRCALVAMGYREANPKVWLKPIAYQAFRFDEEELKWRNFYKDVQGNVDTYQEIILKPIEVAGSWLRQLKDAECFTRTDVCPVSGSSFEFMFMEELLELKGP